MVSIKSDPPTDLETMLKNFAGTRHHSTALKGKQDARKLIKDEFTKYGLHVWSEHATISGVSIFDDVNRVTMATARLDRNDSRQPVREDKLFEVRCLVSQKSVERIALA